MEFKDSDKGKQQLQENGEQTNEIERSKIGIIRALLEREDPSAKVFFFFLSLCFKSKWVLNYDINLPYLLGFNSFM